MNVLVSAASKYGATTEIARSIADTLAGRGLDVTMLEPDLVTDTRGFDAIVLGSAVYTGRWLKSAKTLAASLLGRPDRQPVWLFSSGPVGDPPKPAEDPVDIADVLASTRAVEHRIFAGRIDTSLLGFGERAIVAALRVPAGDYRQWDEIGKWADRIDDALLGASPERAAADVELA